MSDGYAEAQVAARVWKGRARRRWRTGQESRRPGLKGPQLMAWARHMAARFPRNVKAD